MTAMKPSPKTQRPQAASSIATALTSPRSTTSTPVHAPMQQFEQRGQDLLIGNRTLAEIEKTVRQTPFYAYDQRIISETVLQLKQRLPDRVHLHYAIKANPLPAVVNHLAALTDGLDVASAGELAIALDSGIPPHTISFAGPGKNDGELRQAIEADVTINMESANEMRRIADIAQRTQTKARVAIRVNPDFELKTSGMKMSGGPKPFGIDAEQVPEVLDELRELPLDFQGFHIFCGSQNLKAEAIIEAQCNTFELAQRLTQHWGQPIAWLNIGGGLGIPYFPGEQRLDVTPIAANLESLLKQYQEIFGNTEIVMELGRYLVAEAGVYVSKVIDIKDSRGETFVITDGGLNHHLSASGNFGQVIRKNYPVAVGNRLDDNSEKKTVSVVGPLCTPLDILAHKMLLPVMSVGDYVVVYQSGAYGASASPQQFLGHPPVAEILL